MSRKREEIRWKKKDRKEENEIEDSEK